MASVPKGLVLGLFVFAGFVVHGFLTKPPTYEAVGGTTDYMRFNRSTGEYEYKVTYSDTDKVWKEQSGYNGRRDVQAE